MAVAGRSKPLWDDPHGTSGSVATTVIDTVKVIEHATRRATGKTSSMTPEQLEMAMENLYLILTSISNRGVNLWCLEKVLVPTVFNRARYALPLGTVDIKGAVFRTPRLVSSTIAKAPGGWTATLAQQGDVKMVGARLAVPFNGPVVVEYMSPTQPWKTLATINRYIAQGDWLWFDLDPIVSATAVRVRDANNVALPLSELVVADSARDLPMTPMNRDDYHALPDKASKGIPLNYHMEMLIPPIIAVWPVPQDDHAMMVVWRQRQPQDVGGALDKIEVPERWFEAIVWRLAKNLAYELPDIDPGRIQLCEKNADQYIAEAEDGETDGMPLYIRPNISGYTA